MATAEEIIVECRAKMEKAIAHLKEEFATVRTGRATPAVVEKIRVDYYGSEVPLQQLAGFSVPEPRVLVVMPYDKGAMGAIGKAIQQSDLGINPMPLIIFIRNITLKMYQAVTRSSATPLHHTFRNSFLFH